MLVELDKSRSVIIDRIMSRKVSIDEFNFDRLSTVPLYTLLNPYDIDRLYNVASSIRFAGNINKKYKEIDTILRKRDFVKLVGGTNRIAYRHQEIDSIVLKTAVDFVGIQDTPSEFRVQMIKKPFVTKVFEVSPCGTVGMFERVNPITSREEFLSVAPDIFDVITNWFIGEYVMADIGTKYFMNWGYRKGFGPVLLDFPYCYKIDGNKLFCHAPNPNSPTGFCDGVIDYDDGYNYLYCKRCGSIYKARELEKAIEENIIIPKGGKKKMKAVFVRGDEHKDDAPRLSAPVSKISHQPKKETTEEKGLKVSFTRGNSTITRKKKEEKGETGQHGRGSVVVTSSAPIVDTIDHENEDPVVIEKRYSQHDLSFMDFKLSSIDDTGIMVFKDDNSGLIICIDDSNIVSVEQFDQVQSELKAKTVKLTTAENTIEDLRRQLEDAKKENDSLNAELNHMEESVNESCSIHDYNALVDDYNALKREKDELEEQLNRIHANTKENIEAEVIDKESRLHLEEDKNKLQCLLEEKEKTIASQQKAIEELTEQYTELLDETEDLRISMKGKKIPTAEEIVEEVTEEKENTDISSKESPTTYTGIMEIDGKLSTLGALLPDVVKEEDNKYCLVMKGVDNEFMVNEDNEIIVISSIDGALIEPTEERFVV